MYQCSANRNIILYTQRLGSRESRQVGTTTYILNLFTGSTKGKGKNVRAYMANLGGGGAVKFVYRAFCLLGIYNEQHTGNDIASMKLVIMVFGYSFRN